MANEEDSFQRFIDSLSRVIDEYPGDLSDLNLGSDAELLEDYRGRNLLVFSSYWAIDFICRRNPGLKVSEIVVEEG